MLLVTWPDYHESSTQQIFDEGSERVKFENFELEFIKIVGVKVIMIGVE